ncbi:MAG: aminoglycoside phosphotransferase family protein [Trueperaceae bacterium]|nr:aminoglycoside phosphotransferase family protein [Trueperaceae bacterium]
MRHVLADYPDLEHFARTNVAYAAAQFVGWEHAESLVWKLKVEQGSAVYLKAHKQARKFEQELFAYQSWINFKDLAPQVLAIKRAGQRALLLAEVKGEVLEGLELSEKLWLEVYRQAGSFLAQFHALPYQDTDISLKDAFQQRLQAWRQRGRGIVPETDFGLLQAALEKVSSPLKNLRRVPCHRDFSPRNWLWDGSTLRFIDFEHARADLFLSDLVRLASYYFPRNSSFETAFWQGYGRQLTADEQNLLQYCCLQEAITTIIWAEEHQDSRFKRMAQQVFERLRQSL